MSSIQKDISPEMRFNEMESYRGYTLFTPVGGTEIYLIDMKGQPVHTWEMSFELAIHGVLLPNGNLLCAVKVPEEPLADFDGAAGKLLEVDWDGNVVWQHEDPYMHHHFCRLPNGNTLLLRWVPTPKDTTLKVKGGLLGTEREGIMWSDSLREINPAGEVVWEWLGYKHLDPEVDIICPLCFRNEWTHANSFTVTPDMNILISFMKTNSIAIINKETGNIDWWWGGFLKLAHPHGVSLLDNGDVMVLESSIHVAGAEVGHSEILRIDIKTNSVVGEYIEDDPLAFYTPCKASLQQLPNGNTLICQGDTGRVFEIAEGKKIVWEYINPFYHPSPIYGRSNMLFGAYRYGSDYGGLKGNVTSACRVEPVPVEKAKPSVEKAPKAKSPIEDRLAGLGY